jgi:hypothetical protein
MIAFSFVIFACFSGIDGLSIAPSKKIYSTRLLKPLFNSESGENTNVNIFGGSIVNDSNTIKTSISSNGDRMKDQAMKLRREAEEMEIALREEARAKGLPQEAIDKLIPLRSKSTAPSTSPQSTEDGKLVVKEARPKLPAAEIRKKLGYLNTGDAVRVTSELDRLKARGTIALWNSKDLSKANFQVNNLQLTSKTGIEPVSLRLDAVGFEYQKVFAIALISATILGVGSNYIGGQIGIYI